MSSFLEGEDFESEMIILPEIRDLHNQLIRENLRMQINNPFDTKVDHVENFIDKVNDYLEDGDCTEDIRQQINNVRREFFLDVIKLIDDKFSLNCDLDTISDYMVDEIEEICIAMYRFFIIGRKKNIKKIVVNYITEHLEEIGEVFTEYKKKKDVTTAMTKNEIENPNLAMILANLPDIINYFKTLNLSMLDVLPLLDMELFANSKIQDLIDSGIIIDGFQATYFEPIFSARDTDYDTIKANIEHSLYKIALGKKKKG